MKYHRKLHLISNPPYIQNSTHAESKWSKYRLSCSNKINCTLPISPPMAPIPHPHFQTPLCLTRTAKNQKSTRITSILPITSTLCLSNSKNSFATATHNSLISFSWRRQRRKSSSKISTTSSRKTCRRLPSAKARTRKSWSSATNFKCVGSMKGKR